MPCLSNKTNYKTSWLNFQQALTNLSLIFVFILLLSSCQQQNTDSSSSGEVANPGYLRIPIEGISTVDPGLAQFTDAIEIVEQLFLGLTDFDPKTYQVVPELATHWEVSEDGLNYRFYLRRDVFWSDGVIVSAADVVWAIKRNLNAKTKSPTVNMLFPIKNAEVLHKQELKDWDQLGVKAIDTYTLEFTLETPAAYFLALVSLPNYRALPEHVMKAHPGKEWLKLSYFQSNGSYTIKEFVKGSQLILSKNLRYYDKGKTSINQIVYYIVKESSLGFAMYKNDELDILGEAYLRIPAQELGRIQGNPKLRREYVSAPRFCTEIYGFNTKLPPVDNPLVRKALVASINKQLLIDFVVKGNHSPATTFTRPPVFGAVNPETDNVGIAFNPDHARAWLAEAGYPDGQDFPPFVLVHNRSEIHGAIAEAVQTMWKYYLDIEVTIRALDFDSYVDTLYEPKDVHLFRIGWCADYPDANNWLLDGFHPTKSPNFVDWQHAKFEQLVDLAQRSTQAQQRIALYHQAEQILNEEQAVILPIYFASADYLIKPWVKGWYSMAFGGQHVRNWSLDLWTE